jgi:hypothetical protein
MIAKHIPRDQKTSSFSKLVEYIRDLRNEGHKVKTEWATNCLGTTIELATKEIIATQALNTKAQSDKTYHLVVSFRPGEIPSVEQMQDIGGEITKALGLAEHQRIVAVHEDTDHLHMHLAINKIHPSTFKIHNPYWDYLALDAACASLEQKHGLQVDNRIQRNINDTNSTTALARDYEAKTGLQSYESWLRENVTTPLKDLLNQADCDWEQVQDLLAEHNTELRLHGSGLVFSHASEKLFVKASAVDRAFSLKALTKVLGEFKASNKNESQAAANYAAKQFGSSKTSALYDRYLERVSADRNKRNELFESLRNKNKEAKDKLYIAYRGKRSELRKQVKSQAERRKINSLLTAEITLANEERNKLGTQERAKIKQLIPHMRWVDYLIEQVREGDIDARKALQKNGSRNHVAVMAITGVVENENILFRNYDYRVHRNGDITYVLGGGASFIDRGREVELLTLNKTTVEAAILFAMQRYGTSLVFNGADEFKAMAATILSEKRTSSEQVSVSDGSNVINRAPQFRSRKN